MTYDRTVEGEEWQVGVVFQRSGKTYTFNSKGLPVQVGDQVLVRTEKGVDLGQVMEIGGRLTPEAAGKLMPVVRRANEDDLTHLREQEEKEKRALETCAAKVSEHGLPMKLVDAQLSFDNTRLVFYFSAEGRVDFRELVRDLAKTFRKRIELRQIGVRDEAKLLGGIGPCGRRLCCKTFLRSFKPVGIRVAKDQGLALNPSKISGLCDRLMCCLRFEHEAYVHLRNTLPKKGTTVHTEHGVGQVAEVCLLKEELTVALQDGREVKVRATEASPIRMEDRPAPQGEPEPQPGEPQPQEPQEQSEQKEGERPPRRRSRRRRRRPRSKGKQREPGSERGESRPGGR